MTGIKRACVNNIKILRKEDKDFPQILSEMEEPVKQLYCIGDTSLLKKPSVAVVGARKCSEYGRQTAVSIGKALALNNAVTVSGMAYGIDSMAHIGALKAAGGTIAVLGCGPDICYPERNEELYKKICEKGLVVSEYPPGTAPQPWRFPMRNRIISAIASAVAVIEAGEKSGSVITAMRAAEQGREVFALPGNISSPYSVGTNRLIRDGARIITSVEEFLKEAGVISDFGGTEAATKLDAKLGEEEKKVIEAIERLGGASVDLLCCKLNKTPSHINGIIAVLELKGKVYYELGKIFIAKY